MNPSGPWSRVLAILTGLAAVAVWAGWLSGSRGSIVVFILMTLLLLTIAWQFVAARDDNDSWDVRVIDVLTVALAIIVVIGLVVGTAGLLLLPVVMIVLACLVPVGEGLVPSRDFGCTNREGTSPSSTGERTPGWSTSDIRFPHAILTGLVLFGVGQLARDRGLLPPVGDAIGYHLPFVAEWVQSGRLTMPVPAAGDPSPPFYPLNSSLWMWWTAAPFESDVLARFVQAPFFLLLLLAVVRLALELKLPTSAALSAGLLTLSLPDIIRGLALAENDVILAVLLVAATANLALLWRRPTVWRTAMTATLLGLAISTKVLAVPFVAVLGVAWLTLVAVRWRGAGWRRVVTLAAMGALIVLLLGGYSYIRNAVVMSNPSYPVEVQLGGEELLPGLYAATREWKESHPFYPFDWSGFFGFGMRAVYGWTIPLVVLPGLAMATVRTLRERRFMPALLGLWCALSLAVFWFVLPYHFARFLYATVAWSIVVAVWGWLSLFRNRPVWLAWLAIPLATINVLSLPGGSDAWRNPVYLAGAVLIIAGTTLTLLAIRHVRWKMRQPTVRLATGACVLLLVLIWPVYGDRYEEQRFAQWGRLSGFLQSQPSAWQWLWEATENTPATIAVAGTNSTYPLYGPSLENRVLTISSDGHLHEYWWGNPFKPFGEPDRDAWQRTVINEQVDYLWITANVSFGDWPIEDDWAAESERFEPVLIEDDLHVWRVTGR